MPEGASAGSVSDGIEINTCAGLAGSDINLDKKSHMRCWKDVSQYHSTSTHHILICIYTVFPSVDDNMVHDQIVWQACAEAVRSGSARSARAELGPR